MTYSNKDRNCTCTRRTEYFAGFPISLQESPDTCPIHKNDPEIHQNTKKCILKYTNTSKCNSKYTNTDIKQKKEQK